MNRTNLTVIGFFVGLSVFLTGCGANSAKKITPEAAQTNRLDWNIKTLVTAYQNIGNTDSKWDEPAVRALTEFARTRARVADLYEPVGEIITTNCAAAIDAGCDDPMVRYLYIKYCMSQTNSPKAFSDAFNDVESKMQQSQYPAIRKFYVSFRAFQQFTYTYGSNRNADFTKGYQLLDDSDLNLVNTLNDKATPPGEVYDSCYEFLYALPGDINMFHRYYDQIEKPLLANWQDNDISWLLQAHGCGLMAVILAKDSSQSDVRAADLATAEKALNRAWEMNPKDTRIAETMIWIQTELGKGPEEVEMWFNRAMKVDPNDYDACSAKLNYLLWTASGEEAIAFGRECVTNTAWGGTVPLVLVDAHYDLANMYTNETDRMNYYRQPDVWSDISSAYEQYFQNNPDDDGYIAYYARYAYYAEQWKKLNELLPKVKPDYYYLFGGKDAFDQVVQLTKENVPQQ
jgi:hypothetical protein